MSLESTLGNLKKIGALTPHTAPVGEIKQHVDRAANLIGDAQKIQNTLDTRFAISLLRLPWRLYCSEFKLLSNFTLNPGVHRSEQVADQNQVDLGSREQRTFCIPEQKDLAAQNRSG